MDTFSQDFYKRNELLQKIAHSRKEWKAKNTLFVAIKILAIGIIPLGFFIIFTNYPQSNPLSVFDLIVYSGLIALFAIVLEWLYGKLKDKTFYKLTNPFSKYNNFSLLLGKFKMELTFWEVPKEYAYDTGSDVYEDSEKIKYFIDYSDIKQLILDDNGVCTIVGNGKIQKKEDLEEAKVIDTKAEENNTTRECKVMRFIVAFSENEIVTLKLENLRKDSEARALKDTSEVEKRVLEAQKEREQYEKEDVAKFIAMEEMRRNDDAGTTVFDESMFEMAKPKEESESEDISDVMSNLGVDIGSAEKELEKKKQDEEDELKEILGEIGSTKKQNLDSALFGVGEDPRDVLDEDLFGEEKTESKEEKDAKVNKEAEALFGNPLDSSLFNNSGEGEKENLDLLLGEEDRKDSPVIETVRQVFNKTNESIEDLFGVEEKEETKAEEVEAEVKEEAKAEVKAKEVKAEAKVEEVVKAEEVKDEVKEELKVEEAKTQNKDLDDLFNNTKEEDLEDLFGETKKEEDLEDLFGETKKEEDLEDLFGETKKEENMEFLSEAEINKDLKTKETTVIKGTCIEKPMEDKTEEQKKITEEQIEHGIGLDELLDLM